mmetsp:Transcript_3454/g.5216  ORF Transcript_3454/g.5216 Transcript_3454/m.5216 type:complete len:87 (+) Transcript_3454:791-1051(+)
MGTMRAVLQSQNGKDDHDRCTIGLPTGGTLYSCFWEWGGQVQNRIVGSAPILLLKVALFRSMVFHMITGWMVFSRKIMFPYVEGVL